MNLCAAFTLPALPLAPCQKNWLPARRFTSHRCTSTTGFPRLHIRCSAAIANVQRLRDEIAKIAGEERGIFGMEDRDREQLNELIKAVEANNPTVEPTADNARAAAGSWRLLYTNLEILGNNRVRLAIGTSRKPGLVRLGEFMQVIDADKGESRNVVEFDVMALGVGKFTINADYVVENSTRVGVRTKSVLLEPEVIERILGENKPLLTKVFNPDGYLNITYVDDSLRIGRDGRGHTFVLERFSDENVDSHVL